MRKKPTFRCKKTRWWEHARPPDLLLQRPVARRNFTEIPTSGDSFSVHTTQVGALAINPALLPLGIGEVLREIADTVG